MYPVEQSRFEIDTMMGIMVSSRSEYWRMIWVCDETKCLQLKLWKSSWTPINPPSCHRKSLLLFLRTFVSKAWWELEVHATAVSRGCKWMLSPDSLKEKPGRWFAQAPIGCGRCGGFRCDNFLYTASFSNILTPDSSQRLSTYNFTCHDSYLGLSIMKFPWLFPEWGNALMFFEVQYLCRLTPSLRCWAITRGTEGPVAWARVCHATHSQLESTALNSSLEVVMTRDTGFPEPFNRGPYLWLWNYSY